MSKKLSRFFLGLSLVSFGFIIALILIADFDWTERSQAANPDAEPFTNVSKAEAAIQPNMQGGALESFNNAFTQIAEQVTPSVVTIQTEQAVDHPEMGDFFDQFFRQPRDMTRQVLGSGVIIRENGYILTNNHVVARGEEIKVLLEDGTEFTAQDVMTDPLSDLAVLKIDAEDLPAIQMGDSDELRVGEWVMAIGSPFGVELQHTITAGIVSAKGRTGVFVGESMIQDFIQTDAAINPGNSGGALVNLYGQLVGINTAIATRSGGNQGIGFAVPVNMAVKVMNDLIEDGEVTRAFLGVSLQPVDSEIAQTQDMSRPYGAMILEIMDDTPADESNLEEGDIIIELDGNEVRSVGDLQRQISSLEPGSRHEMTVIRKKRERNITVTVGEMPDDFAEMGSGQQEQPESDAGGKLGLLVQNITSEIQEQLGLETTSGVVVRRVAPGSPAAEKDIRQGDVITHVGMDNSIDNVNEFQESLAEYQAGESVLLRVLRRVRGDYRPSFVGIEIPEE